ncbi:MAG: SDR family oxidoreductase [Armatimonadota bacterium]|nr:SDR family oxidoreductase [Armatimonadota bacterium]
MFELNNKVALITGAGSGIGEAIARLFHQQGGRVVIADIDATKGRAVAESLPGALFVELDVTSLAAAQTAVEAAVQHFGALDILVNNAGVGFVGSVLETPAEEFDRLMAINARGVFTCSQVAVRHFLEHGGGNIINIASVAGLIGVERRFAYCASKGAVVAMTRCLAIDYARQNIRANAICPGTVYTPFVEGFLDRFHRENKAETIEKLNARQPVGRMGKPEEIAALALYLASEESAFVTGAAITVDGGWTSH